MIRIPSVQMGVKMNQGHRIPIVEVPGSSQQAPGKSMVTTDANHSLGRVPEPLSKEIDLIHGSQDVKRCSRSITYSFFMDSKEILVCDF